MSFGFWLDGRWRTDRNAAGPQDAARPLDTREQGRMGAAFGADLSNVRLHTDAVAADAARDLGARAFALGEHIGFAAGEYEPGTLAGDALLAHEIAHVLQQREGGSTPTGAGERELELDATGAAVVATAALHGGSATSGIAKPTLRSGLSLRRCTDEEKKQAEAAFQAAVSGIATGRRQPIPIPFPDPDAARGMLDLQYGINREDFIMWQIGQGHSPKWTRFYGTNYVDWSHYLQHGDTFGAIWPHFLQDAWNGNIPRERNRRGIQLPR